MQARLFTSMIVDYLSEPFDGSTTKYRGTYLCSYVGDQAGNCFQLKDALAQMGIKITGDVRGSPEEAADYRQGLIDKQWKWFKDTSHVCDMNAEANKSFFQLIDVLTYFYSEKLLSITSIKANGKI